MNYSISLVLNCILAILCALLLLRIFCRCHATHTHNPPHHATSPRLSQCQCTRCFCLSSWPLLRRKISLKMFVKGQVRLRTSFRTGGSKMERKRTKANPPALEMSYSWPMGIGTPTAVTPNAFSSSFTPPIASGVLTANLGFLKPAESFADPCPF